MDGIALAYSVLPLELIERYDLLRYLHERGGEKEIHFYRKLPHPVLPIKQDGQFRIVAWGSRSRKLPPSGYTWLDRVEAGDWVNYGAQPVEIPATLALQNGIWYPVRVGIKGLIATAGSAEAVYVIVTPATYYYKTMTGASRMPVLIGQQI